MNIRKMALIAVLPVVFGLTGCGNGGADGDNGAGIASADGRSGKPGGSASPGQSLSPEDAVLKYAQCMRQNGVDMKDPVDGTVTSRSRVEDNQKTDAAMKKCQPLMQAGLPKDAENPAAHDKMLKYAQCMRKHGIDASDPKPGQGVQVKAGKASKAKLEAANKDCEIVDEGDPANSSVGG